MAEDSQERFIRAITSLEEEIKKLNNIISSRDGGGIASRTSAVAQAQAAGATATNPAAATDLGGGIADFAKKGTIGLGVAAAYSSVSQLTGGGIFPDFISQANAKYQQVTGSAIDQVAELASGHAMAGNPLTDAQLRNYYQIAKRANEMHFDERRRVENLADQGGFLQRKLGLSGFFRELKNYSQDILAADEENWVDMGGTWKNKLMRDRIDRQKQVHNNQIMHGQD